MEITFDPIKAARNVELGRPSFDLVAEFDFLTALVWQDVRKHYPEPRWASLGLVGERLHALVYAETEHGIHIISFRKANSREVKRYVKES